MEPSQIPVQRYTSTLAVTNAMLRTNLEGEHGNGFQLPLFRFGPSLPIVPRCYYRATACVGIKAEKPRFSSENATTLRVQPEDTIIYLVTTYVKKNGQAAN